MQHAIVELAIVFAALQRMPGEKHGKVHKKGLQLLMKQIVIILNRLFPTLSTISATFSFSAFLLGVHNTKKKEGYNQQAQSHREVVRRDHIR